MERSQKDYIIKDLQKKMVLVAGPRQAGKTTLAKQIAKKFSSSIYLNYDNSSDREIIQTEGWLPSHELIILDEIHKMSEWKNYLKGVYDTKAPHQKILVTGSARLEIFKHVGDSLAGRYFLHRLMPFSPAELVKMNIEPNLDRFLERGGFPEPFLAKNPVDAKRWRMQYINSILKVDALDIENIINLRSLQLLFELLRERVGSPVSYSSLAEDIAISPNTVKKYIQILETLYVIFRVTPFSKHIARSLVKEPKIYFFDVGLVKAGDGIKFENLIASCLLKHVFSKIDYLAEDYSLQYIRTKDKKEVDFALVCNNQIEKLIEVKWSNHQLSTNLLYFSEKYNLKACQVVKELKYSKKENHIEVLDGLDFLKHLYH